LSSCPSPLTTTPYKGQKFCEYPCLSSEYLYWNGSCLSTCPPPLNPEVQGTSQQRNFCWYPCDANEYLYWNGSCLSACPSPLTAEIQGTSLQRKFCWYTCSETQYLYWNGSCLNSCPYPLAPEIQHGVSSSRNFCWYPCPDTQFLYWNGSCLNSCPSPLSSETQGVSQQRNFCWYTCSETQYLYWNNSCIDHCPAPLTSETQGTSQQRNFCWYSCQPSEYLYWNGSCINTCPSPLSPKTQGITQQRNFCWYTCDVTEHLYWNQSCSSHCPIPLVSFDLSGNLFCFLPCSMPNIYWYQDLSCRSECNFPYFLVYRDSVDQCLKPCSKPSEYFYDLEKECHDTCNPPYIRQIINTIKVCHIDASTLASETNKIKSTTQVIETIGKVTSTIIKAASIPQLSTPRSALLIQLSAFMQYIRYMRINYPWRVQLLFQSNGADLISLSFDFSIPNKIQNKFDNYPLPDVFEKYSLDSNFINNMWDLMTSALLVILGIFVLLLLKKTIKNHPKVNHILTRVLQSLRWNIPIAMISGGAGEIVFYASLQTRNTPLDSVISIISLLISPLMISWIIVILVICFKILRGFHLQKQKIIPIPSSETPDWLHKWKGYEILYEEIEEKWLFSLAYMVVYVIRAILFFAIIANLYDYPLAQSILINVINLFIFIYLLCYKSLKDMWNTIQLFINEILGNIITICVLVLAIMDKAEIEARYSRATIGNVIIVTMMIFYVLGVVFLVIEGILFLIEVYQTWKEIRARGIKNPFKMIQILLFGEAKTHPEQITLELSQNSSRVDTSPVRFNRNYLQKSYNNQNIDRGSEIKGRGSSLVSEVPSDSSRFFFPIRHVNPTGPQITESDIQNTKSGIETSRVNEPVRRMEQSQIEPNKTKSDNNASGLVLSTTTEPILLTNLDFIKSWGNLKSRMKRFNRSIHKSHWPDQE